MGAYGETFLYTFSASATILAGILCGHCHYLLTGACCLVRKRSAKLAPAGIADALAEMPIPHQIGDPQVFYIQPIVLAHQCQRRLVVEDAPLASYLMVLLGDQPARLLTPFAPLLAAGEPFLRLGELLLGAARVARVLDRLALGRDEEDLQPHINAHLAARGRQGLDGYVGTGQGDVPAIRLAADRHRLDGAHDWAAPAHRNAAKLGKHQVLVVQLRPVGDRRWSLERPERSSVQAHGTQEGTISASGTPCAQCTAFHGWWCPLRHVGLLSGAT